MTIAEDDVIPDNAELFADNNRGIYIPHFFATTVLRSSVERVSEEDWAILEDPEHDDYWDAWDNVLSGAVINHPKLGKCYLYQDGDLWIVPERR